MKFISSLFFVLNCLIGFSQSNYYVSISGNNGNSGSIAQPWQTIQFGLNQLTNSDTLNVMTGLYNEKISIPTSNIVIRNATSNTPIIDATGLINQTAIVSMINLSNIIFEGFELQNNIQNDAQGILVEGSGSNITVKNCKIHDIHFSSNPLAIVDSSTNAQGIIVYGTDGTTAISNLKIIGNELYNCRLGYSEGIAVNGNVDGFQVINNLVYNLSNIGIVLIGHEGNCPNPANDQARNGLVKGNVIHDCISPYATSGGLYIDGAQLITIENNTSYHNGFGIEVGCENIGKIASNNTIRNNVVYDNEVAGIALGGFDYPAGSGKVTSSIIRNNTFFSNDFSNSGNGEFLLSFSENCSIENNIFYTSNQNVFGFADLTQPGLIFNYNTIYSAAGQNLFTTNWNGSTYLNYSSFVSGSGTNSSSLFGNPSFSSSTTSDFHLTVGSLSINSGNPSFTFAPDELDLDGENRINGNVDCGADEYYASAGIENNEQTTSFELYPNPTSTYLVVSASQEFARFRIINSVGVLAFETSFPEDGIIDLRFLPAGIYFIELTGKEVAKQKFIKL